MHTEASSAELSFESVPLFMTETPCSLEGNVALSALQSLIYDEPPAEIARNFYTQAYETLSTLPEVNTDLHVRNSISFLFKALEQTHEDKNLINEIHTLLSFANFKLGNYGRAFKLVEELKEIPYDQTDPLALLKSPFLIGYQCLFALKKYDALLKWIEGVDLDEKLSQQIMEMKDVLDTKKRQEEANLSRLDYISHLFFALNIRLEDCPLDPFRDMCSDLTFGVADESLSFPVCLLYPPYNSCDFVESLLISQSPSDLLKQMAPFPCDTNSLYDFSSVLYYVDLNQPNCIRRLNKTLPLFRLFKESGFNWVLPRNGRLTFALIPKGSNLFGFTVLV